VAASCLLAAGCEDGNDNKQDGGTNASSTEAAADTAEATTNPLFPDGLHPNAEGSQIIAGVFKAALAGAPGPTSSANDANTVVCFGDSITANYAGYLGGMINKNVITEAAGGTSSETGALRIDGVLSRDLPGYICILYGANDLIQGSDPGSIAGNLRRMIDSARSAGSSPVIATLTPMSGNYSQHEEGVKAANSSIRGLAASTGTPLADLERAF
jgi:lysophospholipase L1-like esterase